jgi:glucosamine-6-phosphate deaminase
VIAMGGTLCRLVEQGHEVHIAHQVSGAASVSDETIWQVSAFARDSKLEPAGQTAAQIAEEFERTGALEPTAQITAWKGLIRRHEAIAAARICGVPTGRLHFLDLPFYNSAGPRSRRIGPRDVEILRGLLRTVQPHLVYAAGDLDDPNGTHRLCLRALREALAAEPKDGWIAELELWLYRGPWTDWPLDEIDLAVPLSPQEVLRRRRAIFRHETQKDQVLFLGPEHREVWQRTEDRSRRLAQAYNALGLAEYEAIEAFRRYAPADFIAQSGI